jgi:glyoxylase-like metal-dependent hydrolase (beta-lactamase superfamily II)
MKSLQTAIAAFTRDLSHGQLHLLVVSHLDYDHVSGLDYLLTKAHAQYVVIPYLSPIERLFLAAKNTNSAPWYYRFLIDPVAFLLE